jgi:hypothetical protein
MHVTNGRELLTPVRVMSRFHPTPGIDSGLRRPDGDYEGTSTLFFVNMVYIGNRPISVYGLGEMPIQSCGQSVSARRGKAGVRLNAHTELRAKRQRSAREARYRNRRTKQCSRRAFAGCYLRSETASSSSSFSIIPVASNFNYALTLNLP